MMNVIIDAGNTRIKVFVFVSNEITETAIFDYSQIDELTDFIKKTNCKNIALCDVSGKLQKDLANLTNKEIFIINSSKKLPITINYKTPETLGVDRIALAVGAELIKPNSNKLIIDFGTAITIDIVTDKKVFEGGNISPGLQTRFRSLAQNTGKLPIVSTTDSASLIGKTTKEAIQNGVIKGILFEINQYILEFNTIFSDLNVFLSGGDAIFFEKMLKKTIFAEPNLLAKGVQFIYHYNVKN